MIQLAICDQSLACSALLLIGCIGIFAWTFTLTYRHNENIKLNKYKGWRNDQRKLWLWSVGLWIVLIILVILPLILIDAPIYF